MLSMPLYRLPTKFLLRRWLHLSVLVVLALFLSTLQVARNHLAAMNNSAE